MSHKIVKINSNDVIAEVDGLGVVRCCRSQNLSRTGRDGFRVEYWDDIEGEYITVIMAHEASYTSAIETAIPSIKAELSKGLTLKAKVLRWVKALSDKVGGFIK